MRKIDEVLKARIIRFVKDEDMSTEEVYQRTGVSTRTVRRILKEAGVKPVFPFYLNLGHNAKQRATK